MIKKLGILLTTSTESENTHTVVKLTEAAINEGMEVDIFLMCDGAYHLNHEELKGLAGKGARVVVCAHNAIERKVDKKDFALWGSQYDLACMVKECDRFLAFN